jgi:hypothetical protein
MKKAFDKLVPKYARVPLLTVLIFNFLVYYGASFIVSFIDRRVDVSVPADDCVPLIPFFIVFYVLAYVQWGVGYIVLSHGGIEHCYRVATADLLAKATCFAFFLIMPTSLIRPEISGGGFFGFATSFIHSADAPVNLFPSIHCLESWVVFRCCLPLKLPKWYKILMGVFTALVFASVVLVKQHVLVDIPAGILVFEAGYLVVRLTKIDKLWLRRTLKRKKDSI